MANKEEKELKKITRLRKQDEELLSELLDDSPTLTKRDKRKRKLKLRLTKRLFRAIDIFFALSQNSCPYVNKTNAGNITVKNDIVYDDTEPDVCKLDFYCCKSEEKQPAIILIHGGGFSAGDKKYRKGRSQFFALNGFSVFCVNYGLSPQFFFPDPLKHIVTAANFVYDNAEKFNIDPQKIFVGGDSAGGYYAAMTAAFNCSDKLKSALGFAPKFKFFGALLNCGVYDIQTVLDTKYPFGISEGVMLSVSGINTSDLDKYKYRDVCEPSKLVSEGYPPTFVIYSDNDVFCAGQGDIMLDVLRKNNIYFEYFSARYSGSNHCFSLSWLGDDAAAANELLLSFAKRLTDDKIKFN